ncbi:MAG: ABC transporter substrate-binding protein [Candidatus Pelagibacter bacterium]|nr:ABC transporter substrate-binding protein [Candidatus Pelagibacter bacterium]MBL6861033.1 ABC transporter substrate-binding protein [Candidatus Pelagibacter bacterium]
MKNKILLLFYILFIFNSNLLSNENNNTLKVGLLAPLSGPHSEIGNSLLYSLQLALEEINDKNVVIVPKDSGFNNEEKINSAINELKLNGVKIIIGPITYQEFDQANKYSDLIFISPSNINPEFSKNIISIGISLESQLIALSKFLQKQKKKNTILMYPKNEYMELIEKKLKILNLKNIRTFKYSPNPEVLTGEIETLTNYSQRKKNLELRKKMFEDKEDEQSKKELERLEQLYTLGDVSFDSIIIIDFGNNLKSVLTSLVYTDVDQENVLFTTINQWFDESIFYENTIKNLYYPSVNYKEYRKYNVKYFERFKIYPNEITILAYDALGLIYYAWKENNGINSINDFLFKNKIEGKIGTFSFKDRKIIQELEIYKTENKKFIKF